MPPKPKKPDKDVLGPKQYTPEELRALQEFEQRIRATYNVPEGADFTWARAKVDKLLDDVTKS